MPLAPTCPPVVLDRLRELAFQSYFVGWPPPGSDPDAVRVMVDNHVWRRYEAARQHLVPWVERTAGLAGRRMVEIGCGTGSSTAGFAQRAARVDGYEIAASSAR